MNAPCVRVRRDEGEDTRQALADRGVLDADLEITEEDGWLYVPVTDPDGVPEGYAVVEREVEPRDGQTVPGDFLDFEPTYERLGDIALLDEADPERAEAAAEAILASDLPIATVANKRSEVRGRERVREWEVLAGDGTETVHREYGCEFLLDVARVYFSPRLATERHRVAQQVEGGERAFDMFAGVGPFAVPFAKRGAEVVGVDVNPDAIEYLRENAERNGVADRVTAIEGDVREMAPEYEGWADRIVMNLPHSADEFLGAATTIAGEDCLVHYYDIQDDDAPFDPGERAIRAAAESAYCVEIEERRVVRSYAPGAVNVCLDARLVAT